MFVRQHKNRLIHVLKYLQVSPFRDYRDESVVTIAILSGLRWMVNTPIRSNLPLISVNCQTTLRPKPRWSRVILSVDLDEFIRVILSDLLPRFSTIYICELLSREISWHFVLWQYSSLLFQREIIQRIQTKRKLMRIATVTSISVWSDLNLERNGRNFSHGRSYGPNREIKQKNSGEPTTNCKN